MIETASLVSATEQLLEALRALDATVTEHWPRKAPESSMIVLQEIGNVHTEILVVDSLSYQMDIWTTDPDTLRSLLLQADTIIAGTGFRRSMLTPMSIDGYGYHQSARYGRKVDKRTLRLID